MCLLITNYYEGEAESHIVQYAARLYLSVKLVLVCSTGAPGPGVGLETRARARDSASATLISASASCTNVGGLFMVGDHLCRAVPRIFMGGGSFCKNMDSYG